MFNRSVRNKTNAAPKPFKEGDWAMLSSAHVHLDTYRDLHPKLIPKYFGPFKVKKRYWTDEHMTHLTEEQRENTNPVAYKLELPHTMRMIYPVFSRSKTKTCPRFRAVSPQETTTTSPNHDS